MKQTYELQNSVTISEFWIWVFEKYMSLPFICSLQLKKNGRKRPKKIDRPTLVTPSAINQIMYITSCSEGGVPLQILDTRVWLFHVRHLFLQGNDVTSNCRKVCKIIMKRWYQMFKNLKKGSESFFKSMTSDLKLSLFIISIWSR